MPVGVHLEITMASTVERTCPVCKSPFTARAADVKRGWGKFCSKSCKAIKQERRTGQHAAYRDRQSRRDDDWGGNRGGEFSDAHLFSNEEHDCNKDI